MLGSGEVETWVTSSHYFVTHSPVCCVCKLLWLATNMSDSHDTSLKREKKEKFLQWVQHLSWWYPNGGEALHIIGKTERPPREDADASFWHSFLLKLGQSILSIETVVSQLCCFWISHLQQVFSNKGIAVSGEFTSRELAYLTICSRQMARVD